LKKWDAIALPFSNQADAEDCTGRADKTTYCFTWIFMRIIADLHIHSGYSRATSKQMTLDTLALWARLKGIGLIGTGDFTHPAHFASIEEQLEPTGNGLFVLKKKNDGQATHFMLSAEVSNIYSQGGKTRKIHSLIFSPSLEAARKINAAFSSLGNISSDGRPIFGFPAMDLVKIVMDASPEAMLVPAHAWTPWFSIFGSRSGFDSIEECFGDYSEHIHAIETGLSSNPEMNWRVSALDSITLISNSDAHSPSKLGREANVFDCAMDYFEIRDILIKKDNKRFLYTIEFYPEEGKYHSDGHRACGVRLTPRQTRALSGNCPECGKPLTVGVLSRVEELSDRQAGFTPESAIPARHLIPLEEILAESLGVGVGSVKVEREYKRLCSKASEFSYLLDMDESELHEAAGARTASAIMKVRAGDIFITPGFDGEFGRVSIFREEGAALRPAPAETRLLQ